MPVGLRRPSSNWVRPEQGCGDAKITRRGHDSAVPLVIDVLAAQMRSVIRLGAPPLDWLNGFSGVELRLSRCEKQDRPE